MIKLDQQKISFLLIFILVGITSGVVGSMLSEGYLNRYRVELESNTTLPRLAEERQRDLPGSYGDALTRVREEALSKIVRFHHRKDEGAYVDSEAVGSGVVLSSDGWVMTSEGMLMDAQIEGFVAVIDEHVYDLVGTVRDPMTKTLFVELSATSLPVVAFADTRQTQVGDRMFISTSSTWITSTTVERFLGLDTVSLSSDAFLQTYVLQDEGLSGTPVFNSDGRLIGVVRSGRTDVSNEVIPLEMLMPALKQALRDGKVERPSLGVMVRMLDRAIGSEEFGVGARITQVSKTSSAGKADLRVGDLITVLGGVEVKGTDTLDHILLDYAPGDIVSLVFSRDGESMSIEVELGAL